MRAAEEVLLEREAVEQSESKNEGMLSGGLPRYSVFDRR